MTVGPRDRFSGLAGIYDKHRPSYPAELFNWLAAFFQPDRRVLCADVGCGTGISTRLLAARGFDVVGVDPNDDMLATARAAGGARYVKAGAEDTGLAGASVDLVTCAQSFHWFDEAKALVEFRRILRPEGWVAAWWNDRIHAPLNDEYEQLLLEYSEDYRKLFENEPEFPFTDRAALGDLREATFPNAQRLDRDGYVGRVASSSYVRHGLPKQEEFFREIDALFGRHARGGFVEILYDCRVWAFRPVARGRS